MSLLAFFEQLADTPWSVSIHESEIAYSLIESIHVRSMCLRRDGDARLAPSRSDYAQGANPLAVAAAPPSSLSDLADHMTHRV